MRFKFRAYDTETKEMSHDYLSKNWLRVCIESPFIELMQWTGLQDKNGVDIYEGDIIRWHDIVTADYAIAFEQGVFCLNGSPNENLYHHRDEITKKWEVVGNVHEHPELLGR
ncbi:YopX family protein [Paenibacillus agaridevorans]|uniref:YopX family protein n=1 Tax=Paenibacillus agaridevorans TaxID=171404 RepID=UPI001BE4973E|nr:YopX family protein [Paenibacillus agaridevorans]